MPICAAPTERAPARSPRLASRAARVAGGLRVAGGPNVAGAAATARTPRLWVTLVVAAVLSACTQDPATLTTPAQALPSSIGSATAARTSGPTSARYVSLGTAVGTDRPLRVDGMVLGVRVSGIADPVTAAKASPAPAPTARLVAVRFRFVNRGLEALRLVTLRSTAVVDTAGVQYRPLRSVAAISAGDLLPQLLTLGAGASAEGWVAFTVPSTSVIAAVRAISPGSGTAAEWAVQ